MIKLTSSDGRTIWINPRLVVSVNEWEGKAAIVFSGDAEGVTVVTEKPEDVAALIDAALS